MTVTGDVSNGQFRILTQTNVAAALTNWSVLSINTYDGSGSRVLTNPVNLIEAQRYFILVQP